jgi:subtilase family serine protease
VNAYATCAYGGNTLSPCDNSTDPYAQTWANASNAGMNWVAPVGDFDPDPTCALINYPAANPYAISVGGTTVVRVGSAGDYGSEKEWYDSGTATECNFFNYTSGNTRAYVGSHGETYGANPYYTAPSWQSALLGNSYRYVPDVSMVANASTGVPIVWYGGVYVVGGTSVGAPTWAGIIDVLLAGGAPHLSGFAAPFLYSHPSCFNSINNPSGTRDGLGTPNIGCLYRA